MMKNLVIVESPAKVKKLEEFLGKDYKVMSSYGHIRDLKKKDFGIDLENLTPEYEIPDDKLALVKSLKKNAHDAETVWLASDEDREGEAISWHLAQVLGLDLEHTKRIVFHEITKNAILEAIKAPRTIDENLVNAQQARRVLDRIVGFKLSPVLWRKLKPSLSAGRVQSVCVRLIVEREREIEQFKAESSYKVEAEFETTDEKGQKIGFRADLNTRFKTEEDARKFLESIEGKTFTVADISKKPMKKTPAPPFTTSTLQQEAAHKLGFTVSQTMMVAQRLYESGFITYMRTDSVNLSTLCLGTSKQEIIAQWGKEYSKTRNYHTSSKGAQEAHEAIRPTYISNHEIAGNAQERKLYELIWKRTLASQMADAETEKTTIKISLNGTDYDFTASGEIVTFDGFLRLYHESVEEEDQLDDETRQLPNLKIGTQLQPVTLQAMERLSQAPVRYTEASLVRKLEELGIGRPSTYATFISTIQQREYVAKGNKPGEKYQFHILKLQKGKIKESTKTEVVGQEKAKLLPTDIGVVVNDFLMQFFPEIMDYHFTANVEKDFDKIAEGKTDWRKVIRHFYRDFEPMVEKTMNDKMEHKMGERVLGTDPKSGKPVSVKIGRFGPVVQIGSATDSEKPRFAQLKKDQSIQTITFEEAMDLFKLPRTIGEYEGTEVTIGTGRFGPYVLHNKTYVGLPAQYDPMAITLEEAVELLKQKQQNEEQKHLKQFDGEPELEVLNGRFGPYLRYKGANYKLPKSIENIDSLTAEKCMEIIHAQENKAGNSRSHRVKTAKS
ncbi:MAG: type I DNA topoisomerase [Bacteroidaceae bacterium]|nr:type I DNA topoisomerase [Bacteroidaceae bacterium]